MDKSKQFYHDVLGLPYSGEHKRKSMVFFRADDHHNLALFLADGIDNTSPALDHVAFELHGGQRELDQAQAELKLADIAVTPYSHSEVQSLYLNPDGNQIELYVHLNQ